MTPMQTPSHHTPPARLPALFLGHGSPMNAIADNVHTQAWRAMGKRLGKPKAVLAISAHWYTRGTFVTAEARPNTLHDFGGFPDALYQVQYPAPGAPALAAEVAQRLGDFAAAPRTDWGLDHGTWSVLRHLYPQADVPVVQLSIDATRHWSDALRIGAALRELREAGVLILGSGGIVHNLGRVDWQGRAPTPEWALRFDRWVADRALAGEDATLADVGAFDADGRLAVPTPDHYLPLLYVLGTRYPDEAARVVHTGFELGSISLQALQLG
jgi:4,5-DOPA dioxygenase extradiol